MNLGFWVGIAKVLLPWLLKKLVAAERAGIIKEAERNFFARQMVAYAEELNLWIDIQDEVRTPEELRNILTGRNGSDPGGVP